MITIIDYGLGNIQAFVNVYRRLHIPVTIARTVEDLHSATKLILPGVGAFDHAMERLNASGMRAMLDELVLVRKIPVIGICVGMQMLADSSDEGSLPGLGWVPGRVRHFGSVPGLTNLLCRIWGGMTLSLHLGTLCSGGWRMRQGSTSFTPSILNAHKMLMRSLEPSTV